MNIAASALHADPHRLPLALDEIESSMKNDSAIDGGTGRSNLVRKPSAASGGKDEEIYRLNSREYRDDHGKAESTSSSTDTASDYSQDTTAFDGMLSWVRKKVVQYSWNSELAEETSSQTMTIQSIRRYINRDSPWVLPIKVHTQARQDKRKMKWKYVEATFDTGMEQGNMASYDIVANLLHTPENALLALTPVEKQGGISVNGDRIIPIGAVELTWKGADKGARIFRNMRFLVTQESLDPPFQLVIGAKSLAKEKILGAPALIAASSKNIVVMPKGTKKELQLADTKALQNETEAAESEAVFQRLLKEKREKQAAKQRQAAMQNPGRGSGRSTPSASDSASDSGF